MKVRRHRQPRRRGFVLLIVLACAAIAASVLAATIRTVYQRNRFLITSQQARQCELLADSGIARALAKLTGDAKYVGEIWKIPPVEMGGPDAAQVVIAVRSSSNRNHIVAVTARFPDAATGAQATREITARFKE